MIRRLAGLLFLLLGVVGLAFCLAGVVGLWRVRPVLTERGNDLGKRADLLLDKALASLSEGKKLLKKAGENLDELHKTAQKPPQEGAEPNSVQKMLIKQFATKYSPEIGDADRTVNVALNTAVVLNTMLDGLDDIPAAHLSRLDKEKLKNVSANLEKIIGSGEKLRARLQDLPGDPKTALDEETQGMKDALDEVSEQVTDFEQRVKKARDVVTEVRTELPGWITTAAVALTALLVWIGLGQLFLAVRGGVWLFGLDRSRRTRAQV
jgi:hypothetical protein